MIRGVGFSTLMAAWLYSGLGASMGASRNSGRSIGLADRLHAHTVYAITGIPYSAIAFLLWRPLPIAPGVSTRVVLLIVGSLVGFTGAAFYLWGRHALGSMYDVSSSLGSELYESHVLVVTGPHALCRHPMYFGLFLAAGGGLIVYHTGTLVFMLLAHVGALFKAHRRRAPGGRVGTAWERYAAQVPQWIPRIRRRETPARAGTSR